MFALILKQTAFRAFFGKFLTLRTSKSGEEARLDI